MKWSLLVVPLLLSGCVTELLGPDEVTVRTVTCAVLDPTEPVTLTWHGVDGDVPATAAAATDAWFAEIGNITGRPAALFDMETAAAPAGPWDQASLETWRIGLGILDDGVGLHALWVPDVGEPGRAVVPVAAGVIAINSTVATDLHTATGLLFHGMGHALGAVNRGTPMVGPDIAGREGPPGHEPDGDSVMAEAWHRIVEHPVDATADRYSDAVVQDWQHAAGPDGVCA